MIDMELKWGGLKKPEKRKERDMFDKMMNKLLFIEIPAVGFIFLSCRWPNFFHWTVPIVAFATIVVWSITIPAVYLGRWLWRQWKPAPIYIYRDWSRYENSAD